jgi:hypothetical protein
MRTIALHLEPKIWHFESAPVTCTHTFLFRHVSHENALFFGWRLEVDGDDMSRVVEATRDL